MPVQLPESFSQNPTGVEIGLWPLAWGWWVLVTIIIISATLFVLWYRSYRKKRLVLIQAIAALKALDTDAKDYLAQCNRVLKRAFLSYFSEPTVASLHGKDWQDFLRQNLSDKKQRQLAPFIEQLGAGMYLPGSRQSATSETQKQALSLLKATLPPGKKQLSALEETA